MIQRTKIQRTQSSRVQSTKGQSERDYPEAADYIRRVIAVGGTVTMAEERAVYEAVRYLYKLNLRQYIDDLCIFGGNNITTMLVKLFRGAGATSSNLSVQSGTTGFSSTLGFTNTNAILNCNINANNYVNNNFGLIYFKPNNIANNATRIFGTNGSGLLWTGNNSNNNYWDVGQLAHPYAPGQSNLSGCHVLTALGNTDKYWFKNGKLFAYRANTLTPSTFASNSILISEGGSGGCSIAGTMFGATPQQAADISEILIDMEIARGRTYMLANNRVRTYVFQGDSLTFGFLAPTGQLNPNWPVRLQQLGYTGDSINLAQTGKSLMFDIVNNPSVWTIFNDDTRFLKSFNFNHLIRTKINCVFIWIGTNDMGNFNQSAATIKASLDNLCQAYIKLGVSVIVLTYIPSSTYAAFPNLANYNTQAPLLNAAIVADANYTNGVTANAIVRIDQIPECANPNNTTWFQDGIHPTQALSNIIATAVQNVIIANGF